MHNVAHAALRGHFLEVFPGRVLPNRKGLALQCRGYQVGVFIVVIIAKIQPHSGYEAAVFGQRHAFLKRNFLELVAQIVEQEIVRSVVGHEDVGTAIQIVIGHAPAHALPHMRANAPFLRHVLELAIALVQI